MGNKQTLDSKIEEEILQYKAGDYEHFEKIVAYEKFISKKFLPVYKAWKIGCGYQIIMSDDQDIGFARGAILAKYQELKAQIKSGFKDDPEHYRKILLFLTIGSGESIYETV